MREQMKVQLANLEWKASMLWISVFRNHLGMILMKAALTPEHLQKSVWSIYLKNMRVIEASLRCYKEKKPKSCYLLDASYLRARRQCETSLEKMIELLETACDYKIAPGKIVVLLFQNLFQSNRDYQLFRRLPQVPALFIAAGVFLNSNSIAWKEEQVQEQLLEDQLLAYSNHMFEIKLARINLCHRKCSCCVHDVVFMIGA
uniref:Uncharacterized protein n=1 Tax=Ditylenchus dipsaci TaxID=166011 RepID=A0A915DXU4_9BILA